MITEQKPVTREELAEALRGLFNRLPHHIADNAVGYCAGCGAILWCGDGKPRDPCKPDCILAAALSILSRLDAEQKGGES